MFTQSVKSPALLLILCATVLVIDSLVIFKLKQKVTNWKLRLPLLANVAIPIGGYLAFSDQQDEMYIWASKIENFLLSGRLGVELFDGNFGESSVSTLVFIVAAVLKIIFAVTTEQSLYITNVLAAIFTILVSQIFFIRNNVRSLYSHVPAIFLITSYGFISSVSMSFDVSFTLLYCQVLLLIFFKKDKILTYQAALIIGIAEWIRLEVSIFKVLFLILITSEVIRNRVKINYAIKIFILTLAPSALLILYKLWAFDGLTPAMVHFKSLQMDPITFLRTAHYYFASLGPIFFALLIWIAILYCRQPFPKKQKIQWLASELPNLYSEYWFFIGIVILLLAPVYAGPDYYGPMYQRYVLTPVYLALCSLIWIHRKKFLRSESKISTVHAPFKMTLEKISTLLIVAILSISANSFVSGWFLEQGGSLVGRPSRATCDQMLGPTLRDFWKSKSDKPLIIATSEANGIAYSSSAKLLDMSGVVDSRNYPTIYQPMTPGSMYAKFQFKDSIHRERPSIVWPAYSESCSFFNPLSIHQKKMETQLQTIYDFNFTKHWFPTQEQLVSLGYCPHQIKLERTGPVNPQVSFYYLCSAPEL